MAEDARADGRLVVTVLGAGDAFCSGGEPHAAYLFETPGATFLVDCGPTVLLSLKRHGIDTARLDFAVISHLHGDHFGGLPFLLLEYVYERPRTRPFVVLGPRGTEARLRGLFRALYPDVVPEELPFALEVRELEPERTAEVADVKILPVRVPHQVDDVALALGIESHGKRVLYTGDSPWVDRFVELARGADLFLCECTGHESPLGRHIDWRTLRPLLPRLACRRLVLVHLGREMRAHAGELGVECAVEGLRISL
jgi:ribonuclease BN (tRNA processing enzyme)